MRILTLVIACLLGTTAFCQEKIKTVDAANRVGDSLSVCGKVSGGRYLEKSKGQPTLLNLDGNYPNNAFTALIFSEARALFKNTPETYYKDSNVCITGRISLYNGKPQIIINNPNQVRIQNK